MRQLALLAAGTALFLPAAALAQTDPHAGHQMPDMPGMAMPSPAPAPTQAPAPAPDKTPPASPAQAGSAAGDPHAGHDMSGMSGMGDSHAGHDMPAMSGDMAGMPMMPAMLGPYAMNREASGTAWQPDSSPMAGAMLHAGDWSGMAQGYVTLVQDHQGGPRGDDKTFSESMAMLMANRPVGEAGRLGLRAMLSLDPLMGPRGYPLLFATGETADGVTGLVDRQHPHDLFMELAASYSHDLGDGRSVFLYAGLPGEPALGPPTFMHRVSGMDNPEAPIGHHWFDSTHITWGVLTAGYSTRTWKVEGSWFKGREPDQHRWDIEAPRLDSWSVRAFWNPTRDLSLQLSTGHLTSPEQLHPDQDEQRTTASAIYNRPLGPGANLSATVAWSRKDLNPGPVLNGWLAEGALRWANRHTVFARGEREDENELFDDASPLHDRVFPVHKLTLGYQYELPLVTNLRLALGGLASAYAYPRLLEAAYGGAGVKSLMLYARVSFGDRMAH